MKMSFIPPGYFGDSLRKENTAPLENRRGQLGSSAAEQFKRLVKGDQSAGFPDTPASVAHESGAERGLTRPLTTRQSSQHASSAAMNLAVLGGLQVLQGNSDQSYVQEGALSSFDGVKPRVGRENDRTDLASIDLPVNGVSACVPTVSSPVAELAKPSATADSNAFSASLDRGELVQLLATHCKGVFVGSCDGAMPNRVMLSLGGVMGGVSVEIVNAGAALSIRMHVVNQEKWSQICAHRGALELELARISGSPVRIEPVFEGGRS